MVRRGLDAPRQGIAGAVRRSQRGGELPPGLDPDAVARTCVAVFHGLVLQQAWDERLDLHACDAMLEAVLGGSPTAHTRLQPETGDGRPDGSTSARDPAG